MNSSTTIIDGNRNVDNSTFKGTMPKFIEPKPPVILVASLWLFQSIFSASKMEFIGNLQGISLSFNMQDVVIIAFAAWMLHRGLSTRNIALIFPWVIVTLYGLYFNHYKSLRRMMAILKAVRHTTGLPWMALFLTSIGLEVLSDYLPLTHPSVIGGAGRVSEGLARFVGWRALPPNKGALGDYDLLIVDYDPLLMDGNAAGASSGNTADDGEEASWNCSVHPSVFFLLGTLVLTTCATGMLCAAIMTDHWEEVTWDMDKLELLANSTVRLQWLLDRTVARVSTNDMRDRTIAFLVPMHGGIWTLCLSLTDEEIDLLGRVGFPSVQPCVNYLSGVSEGIRAYEPRADWQHRMQNLSISCALVCLIVLGSAALVGAFGVFQHQISAVLVTGVMYLLAASFALFTLTIIHFKRLHIKPHSELHEGTVDGVVSLLGVRGIGLLLPARIFTTSWSLDLGWGGVMLCVMTSVLWILLSKIMRFNPISSMIN